MLQGVRLVTSLVERRGVEYGFFWASRLGRHPVGQWEVSRLVA
jgi:hypothetical protein